MRIGIGIGIGLSISGNHNPLPVLNWDLDFSKPNNSGYYTLYF